jgi:hypothetical protein
VKTAEEPLLDAKMADLISTKPPLMNLPHSRPEERRQRAFSKRKIDASLSMKEIRSLEEEKFLINSSIVSKNYDWIGVNEELDEEGLYEDSEGGEEEMISGVHKEGNSERRKRRDRILGKATISQEERILELRRSYLSLLLTHFFMDAINCVQLGVTFEQIHVVIINDYADLTPVLRVTFPRVSGVFSMESERRVLSLQGQRAWLQWDELCGAGGGDWSAYCEDWKNSRSLESISRDLVSVGMPPLPGVYQRVCGRFSFDISVEYFGSQLLMFEPFLEENEIVFVLNSSIWPALSFSLTALNHINVNITPALLATIGSLKVSKSF